MTVKPLTAPALAAWLADDARAQPLLVDVREPWEYATCRIAGSRSMPMNEIAHRQAELDIDRPIVCICHHGARSQQAAAFLASRGADDVHNLTGGVDAWAREVDGAFPTY